MIHRYSEDPKNNLGDKLLLCDRHSGMKQNSFTLLMPGMPDRKKGRGV